MPEIKIVRVARVPSTMQNRLGKFERVVVYTVDGATVYTTMLPDEEATDQKIEETLRKEVTERQRLVGRTFKV